jgi:hypothetical protein
MLTEGQEMTEEKMRSIARKMFIGGFFLLPWLWLVNVLLFVNKWRSPSTSADVKWCTQLIPGVLSLHNCYYCVDVCISYTT